jgi:hypothetical protein
MSALGHKRPIFHVAMALQNGRYTPESDEKLAISDRPPPGNYAFAISDFLVAMG